MIPVRPRRDDGIVRDRMGRAIHDLRISVTDRCNFRCTYCMPRDKFGRDHAFLPRGDLLSFEEITRVARIAVSLGVRKIRLTGGEPLLRRELHRLVEMLREIPGIEIALTTNGALLARHAVALRQAGLDRVTVSLDALDDATFRRMNDVNFPVAEVLRGIDAAAEAGFVDTKINMVVRRGINDGDIIDMARYFRGSGHILRFIEYMDVGRTNGWRLDEVVPADEIIRRINADFPLIPLQAHYRGEVAERWRYVNGAGEIGVIAAVTQAFCQDCTRLRLSPEGKLFTCLFAGSGHDLRARLRGADDDALSGWMAGVWSARQDRYSELRGQNTAPQDKIEMSYIGG
ncbi:MAG: GTP 3',8-cyclase MoaA [Rhodocyclaceae bacterium]